MISIKLDPGVRFKIDEEVFTILKVLKNSKYECENEDFGTNIIYTSNELYDLLRKDKLKFEVFGKNTKENDRLVTQYNFEDIEHEKHKDIAIFRFNVIRPLLYIPKAIRTKNDIIKRVEEVKKDLNNFVCRINDINYCDDIYLKKYKVSVPSVYRWINDFYESEEDFRALLPSYMKCGGKDSTRFSRELLELIRETIKNEYLTESRISIVEAFSILQSKIQNFNKYNSNKIDYPSLSTFRRYIIKIPEYELVAKRIGKNTAEKFFSPIGNGVKVTYPLERVEIDSTPIDLIIISEDGEIYGRPNFTAATDKLTGSILGFEVSFGGVGWPEVMQCIRHIMDNKSYVKEKYPLVKNDWDAFGVPKSIIVDNGLGYKNNSMKDACYQLGFVLEFCPPRDPQWKGSIERFFRTINTKLIHNLPGTTRSNPRELGDGENPNLNASIRFSLFLAILHKWVIDVYQQDINRGVEGIPSILWKKANEIQQVSWPSNLSELVILLGRVEYRVIRNKGIELNCLNYNSVELNRLLIKFSLENEGFEQKFKIKYDPSNISEIFVYDHIIEKRWIKVLSTNPEYTRNLSEWEHNQVRAYARKVFQNVDLDSLIRAKYDIRKLIEDGTGFNNKQIARANNINSSNEMFGSSNLILEDSSKQDTKYLNNNFENSKSISDFGIKLKPIGPDNSIVPAIKVIEDYNNVVEIKNKNRSKNKHIKKQDREVENSANENTADYSNNVFNVEDYKDVKILNRPIGDYDGYK